MFAYLNPTDSIAAVMSGAAATTNPVYHVIYGSETGGKNDSVGSLNGTTAATLVAAPTAGQRQVERIEIFNGDTAAVTISVAKVVSGTSTTIRTVTLQVSDTLYIDDSGAKVLDVNGMSRIIRTGYTIKIANRAKAGTTAGWTVAAGNNIGTMATVAASQTSCTLVIPIDGLHVGDTITAFSVYSSINSAGNAVTLDANLRSLTIAAAASATDASIGSITQVSVTAATASSATKSGLSTVVTAGVQLYLLLTCTTAASTTLELDAVEITVTTA